MDTAKQQGPWAHIDGDGSRRPHEPSTQVPPPPTSDFAPPTSVSPPGRGATPPLPPLPATSPPPWSDPALPPTGPWAVSGTGTTSQRGPLPLGPTDRSGRWRVAALAASVVAAMTLLPVLADRGDGSRAGSAEPRPTATAPVTRQPVTPAPQPSDRPADQLEYQRFCSEMGPFEVRTAPDVVADGPRPLQHIPAPAQGTFRTSYSDDGLYRFDVITIERLDGRYPDDQTMVREVLTQLDGQPGAVTVFRTATRLSHAEAWGSEQFDDRMYETFALGARGNVTILSVAVPLVKFSDQEIFDEQQALLHTMRSSLLFGILDRPEVAPAPC